MFSRNRPDRDDRAKSGSYLKGRGNRTEYWTIIGLFTVLGAVLPGMSAAAATGPMLVFTIRRLHDFGQSGWWSLLPIGVAIPATLAILVMPAAAPLLHAALIMCGVMFTAFVGLMPGDAAANRFGDPPPSGLRRKRESLRETFS